MKIGEIAKLIDGEVLVTGAQPDLQINHSCAADLLSDVLTLADGRTALITGLTNPQVMRVAEILNIIAVIFVRAKVIPQSLIDHAERVQIPVIASPKSMFETCGLLYTNGVRQCGSTSCSNLGSDK